MRSNRSQRRNPSIELLETRTLLDGAVTANLVDGNLLIRCDDMDNRITIDRERQRRDTVRILVDTGSTINGSSDPLIIPGVTGDIVVELLGGNDRLTVRGLKIREDLIVDGGDGDDITLVHRGRIGGNVRVDTAAGNDSVHLVESHVKGATRVDTGDANDAVVLERSKFKGDVVVNTSSGDDSIVVASTFRGNQTIDPGTGMDTVGDSDLSASFDFRNGAEGWQAGFADYRAGDEEFFGLEAGIRPLPAELGEEATGYYIHGSNHSDDLFMFLKRRLGSEHGLAPNQTYQVRVEVRFASNVPTGCAGIGGSPGESVWLKAGASAIEPLPVAEPDGFLRMNVDKGNQSSSGEAASVVGPISNAIPCDDALRGDRDPKYVSLLRPHVHETVVRSNERGELWLLVGTDSGFEGPTALYFQQIDVTVIRVSEPVPPPK